MKIKLSIIQNIYDINKYTTLYFAINLSIIIYIYIYNLNLQEKIGYHPLFLP